MLDGGRSSHSGGSIKGTGQAVRAAMVGLVIVSGAGVTGHQTSA